MKTSNEEKTTVDLLIENKSNAAVLILKRRRLLRKAETVRVAEVGRFDGLTWIKATLPVPGQARNAWDVAYETAAQYQKELGQCPYIEPDCKGGRFELLASAQDSDATTRLSGFDPSGDEREPFGASFNMPGMPSVPGFPSMPGLPSIPGMPSNFGLPSIPDMPSIPGLHQGQSLGMPNVLHGAWRNRALGAAGGLSSDSTHGSSLDGESLVVPVLGELCRTHSVSPARARMFEVEAAQLFTREDASLRALMADLAPQMHMMMTQAFGVDHSARSCDDLRSLMDSGKCSMTLRAFLQRALEIARHPD